MIPLHMPFPREDIPSPRYAGMILYADIAGMTAEASPRYAGMIPINIISITTLQTSPRYAGMIL